MICIWSSWCHCHPIISCFSKILNGLPFWCRLTQVVLEKRPLNVCMCMYVSHINHVLFYCSICMTLVSYGTDVARFVPPCIKLVKALDELWSKCWNDILATIQQELSRPNVIPRRHEQQHILQQNSSVQYFTCDGHHTVNFTDTSTPCTMFRNCSLMLSTSFSGLFSRTTWVSRHQKSRTTLEQEAQLKQGLADRTAKTAVSAAI